MEDDDEVTLARQIAKRGNSKKKEWQEMYLVRHKERT